MYRAIKSTTAHVSINLKKNIPLLAGSITKGLCSNCNHAESCYYQNMSASPVFYCEEFDDSSPSHAVFGSKLPRTKMSQPVNEADNNFGICLNCFHQKTCGFCNPNQTKIFCEEYY